jgi:hypothetical protein
MMEPLNHRLKNKVPIASILVECFNVWLEIPEEKCEQINRILDEFTENALM